MLSCVLIISFNWLGLDVIQFGMISRICSPLTSAMRYSFGYRPSPYTGPAYNDLREQRKKYMLPFMVHYYKDPILITEGFREYLYDQNGKEYIDLHGGFAVVNSGHNHPRINKIYQEQSDRLMHISPIYMH